MESISLFYGFPLRKHEKIACFLSEGAGGFVSQRTQRARSSREKKVQSKKEKGLCTAKKCILGVKL